MGVTLDGQRVFDEGGLRFEFGSWRRDSVERSAAGLDGVVSVDMGCRSREDIQRGTIRASSRVDFAERLEQIDAFADGGTHTLVRESGEQLCNLRMDSFEVSGERTDGAGVVADYEIVWTQLAR